jgi:hypothetical protein
VDGAGDCERGGVGAELCGGPLDQADFVGIFGAVAVEDLLILNG